MLKLDNSLDAVANFAVDIAGMATRYEFTVFRWGTDAESNCCVSRDWNEKHAQWLAVDVSLSDATLIPRFVTDCAIAGLFCIVDDQIIHIQNVPLKDSQVSPESEG